MKSRKKSEQGDGYPSVWGSVGTAHPSSDTTLYVHASWALSGVTCTASAKAPGRADYLRACIKLDHPGARPAAAARWLDQVTPSVDKAYAKAKIPVASPLYRSGHVVSYLQEYNHGQGVTYSVTLLGTPRTKV